MKPQRLLPVFVLGLGLTLALLALLQTTGAAPRELLAASDGSGDSATPGAALPPGVSAEWWAAVQAQLHDGMFSTGPWTATGANDRDSLGKSVASAGDVNGDGYADVIVGVPNYDTSPTVTDTGRVYVYTGTPNGLSTTPAFTATGQNAGDFFGTSVASAGDVNGDGYSDVIVGAHMYDASPTLTNTGKVYVYHGSASGLSATPAFTATGEGANGYFGYSAATAGDVNGDGYADVVVGAYGYRGGDGALYIYYGSAGGLTRTGVFSSTGGSGESVGWSVATAGDVNGDGYADVAVGSHNYGGGRGRMHVGYGSSTGVTNSAVFSAAGQNIGDHFGFSVAPAGDVNGDGYADVAVGAHQYNSNQGAVYVYYGGSGGLNAANVFSMTGQASGEYFGASTATAGDVNGDGYGDVVIGAYGYSSLRGRVYVGYGSSRGVSVTALLSVTGENTNDRFGASVATAGDVNGDGFADVIVGAPYFNGGGVDWGRAYVYAGGGEGLSAAPVLSATGQNAGDELGSSVATAGDVNGDGLSDVIVAAQGYLTYTGRVFVYHGSASGLRTTPAFTATGEVTNTYFGCSAATAGDVNGDGYADVVVGAYGHDASPVLTDSGKVYVYLGSASGLSTTVAFSATGENAYNNFGASVASAGDVNGDGYADVVIGAPNATPDLKGRVYVYHGSASGLGATPAFTATGEEGYAYLGYPVASAGDVNGDGFGDVIAVAEHYYGPTWVYVYYGSNSGLGATPPLTVTRGSDTDWFGKSVATAGDVNGDGYADVVVGAEGYLTYTGRVYVYHGGAAGLSVTPAFTATGEATNDRFGRSVATAGDVDDDGYTDVVVGADYYGAGTGRGRVYVYHGSAGGLSGANVFSITGQPADSVDHGFENVR